MNFFKSVFSEESDPELSNPSPSTSPPQPTSNPNPNPNRNPNPWSFGTLIKTLASNPVLDTYKRDLADFTSGLRTETAAIRAAAARAASDLPASLEAGAAAAADSLEAVGEAIDNIGSAVSEIITQGLSNEDEGLSNKDGESNNHDPNSSRPYSRLESLVRSIQCDINTYCKEVEELGQFEEWKLGFDLGEKMEEIEGLLEENGVMGEIYDEVVPKLVDQETFWTRYFFKVYKVTKAEEARVKLVNRAIMGEDEEDLSWDVEDDDNGDSKEEKDVPELKRECGVEEGEKLESGRRSDTKSEEKLGSCKDSDFSVVSSQPSMAEEGDIGWDEIEDGGSLDEIKVSTSESPNVDELRARLNAMGEEEEDLGWDIEDDDEPLKS